MKPLRSAIFIVTLSLLSLSGTLVSGQEASGTAAASDLKPGVVVEGVEKNLGAEQAGLQPGDVLLEWSRGDSKGEIHSPFDVMELETEQAPLGTINLEGFRGTQRKVWSVGQDDWGLTTEPNFAGEILSLYRKGQELADTGKLDEMKEGAIHWEELANRYDDSQASWIRDWLFFHSAQLMRGRQQWKEADDAYRSAVQFATETSSMIESQILQAWAKAYAQRNDWINAEKYFQQSLDKIERSGSETLTIAAILYALGTISSWRGDLNKAEQYFSQALAIRTKLAPASLAAATSLNGLCIVASQQGNLTKAEQYGVQALDIQQKLSPTSLAVAGSLDNLGIVAAQRGDLTKAEEYWRKALNIEQKLIPGSLSVAKNLGNLAIVVSHKGDLVKAEDYERQALDIEEKLAPGSLDVASSLNNLGNFASRRGEPTKAEEYYRQALGIRQKLAPGSLGVAASLINLGMLAHTRGELGNAEQYYHQALDIQRKLAPNSLDISTSFYHLGRAAFDKGDLTEAERYYQETLEIVEKTAPISLDMAEVLDGIAHVLLERGEFEKAEQYYRQALDIRRKLVPRSFYVAGSLNNLGSVAVAREDLEKAEQYYRQALDIQRNLLPSSLDVARILNNLGIVVSQRGNFSKAKEYYDQALELEKKLAPSGIDLAMSFNNLGWMASERGDLVKAEEYFSQASTIYEKVAPRGREMAATMQNLGNIARRSRKAESAEQYYHQALAIRQELSPGSLEHAVSLAAVASIFYDQQQFDRAAQFYEQAVRAVESQTMHLGGPEQVRFGFRAHHSHFYKDYVDLLLALKEINQAFEILERSRARGMLERLAAAHVNIRNGVEPSLLQQEQSLQESLRAKSERRISLLSGKYNAEQLTALEKEIADLGSQYQEIEGRIRSTSPVYAALTQPKPLSAQEVQQLLDTDTVLLEYSLSEEHSHVFMVTFNSLNVYELPKGAEIERAARRVHRLLTVWDRTHANTLQARNDKRREVELKKASATLSWMILGPIAEQIKGKRLLIVSDGVLEYIPFAALLIPATPNRSGAQTPLIAEHEIVNLPSASVLAELRQQVLKRQTAPKTVAVVADPVFDKDDERVRRAGIRTSDLPGSSLLTPGPNVIPAAPPIGIMNRSISDVQLRTGKQFYLPRLPFTRREAQKILAVTPAGQGMAALDFKANRATLFSPELAQYRIVHIATHGLIDSANPGFSGLVLSLVDEQGKPQDGFLGLEDIYNLNINADLVVLSACQTGLGKQIEGEGLIGMTRGFMYAGASRVLASLWNAEDEATAELMAQFYKAMEQDHLSPAAALRQAQIQMWKQKRWSDPYYWAGFQMQGEWK